MVKIYGLEIDQLEFDDEEGNVVLLTQFQEGKDRNEILLSIGQIENVIELLKKFLPTKPQP